MSGLETSVELDILEMVSTQVDSTGHVEDHNYVTETQTDVQWNSTHSK